MNITEAIQILRRYQDWRRGYDVRTMAEADIAPEKIGAALDAVLSHFGASEPLTVCAGCPMARLEREIGHSCINGVFLDELDPTAGRHDPPIDIDCGVYCLLNLG